MKSLDRRIRDLRDSLIAEARATATAFIPSTRAALRKIGSNPAWGQRGASLLEMLVALALLGTSGTASLKAMSTGELAVNTIAGQAISKSLASSQLEAIRRSDYQVIYPIVGEAPTGYSLSISAVEIDSDLQKIEVTVLRDGQALLSLEDFKVRMVSYPGVN